MPGKVNPMQCEAITMEFAQVFFSECIQSVMVTSGERLQLARLVGEASASFSERCVNGIAANELRIHSMFINTRQLYNNNVVIRMMVVSSA